MQYIFWKIYCIMCTNLLGAVKKNINRLRLKIFLLVLLKVSWWLRSASYVENFLQHCSEYNRDLASLSDKRIERHEVNHWSSKCLQLWKRTCILHISPFYKSPERDVFMAIVLKAWVTWFCFQCAQSYEVYVIDLYWGFSLTPTFCLENKTIKAYRKTT